MTAASVLIFRALWKLSSVDANLLCSAFYQRDVTLAQNVISVFSWRRSRCEDVFRWYALCVDRIVENEYSWMRTRIFYCRDSFMWSFLQRMGYFREAISILLCITYKMKCCYQYAWMYIFSTRDRIISTRGIGKRKKKIFRHEYLIVSHEKYTPPKPPSMEINVCQIRKLKNHHLCLTSSPRSSSSLSLSFLIPRDLWDLYPRLFQEINTGGSSIIFFDPVLPRERAYPAASPF